MAVVAVMSAVADPPAMVRHQYAGVCYVAHQIIQVLVIAEALMTTVESIKHGVACAPHKPLVTQHVPVMKLCDTELELNDEQPQETNVCEQWHGCSPATQASGVIGQL
jgi:hypothetical protein